MISDIEKNRSPKRMADKIINILPALQNILRTKDPTETNHDTSDHAYQTGHE